MVRKELADLSDEAVGLEYLSLKSEAGELETYSGDVRADIMNRVSDRGTPTGNNVILKAGQVEMKKEGRVSRAVKQVEAVKLWESKNWTGEIEAVSTIALRASADPAKIPVELLKQMDQFFDITTEKKVSMEQLEKKLAEGLISQKEYENLVDQKTTFALKVKKV